MHPPQLVFSPTLRLLNVSPSSHLTYRVDCGAHAGGKGTTVAFGALRPKAERPLMLRSAAGEDLRLHLQLEGYSW